MSKSDLFDVLKDQFFDRLVSFDEKRKSLLKILEGAEMDKLGEEWLDFATNCAFTLSQIATASRLERYEYQETLTENIRTLKTSPKAFELLVSSRDQSILLEFLARALSQLYYETVIEGICNGPRDPSVIFAYAQQAQELSELILFGFGKELQIEQDFLKIFINIGKINFESNLNEQLESFDKKVKDRHKDLMTERRIKNLRYKGTLYKDHYSKILAFAKEDFWWDDHILKYCLYTKADKFFSEARELLLKNPFDPSLLMTIDFEIALCKGQALFSRGEYFLELAINTLIQGSHQEAYDFFIQANRNFNDSLNELQQASVESIHSQELINQIKANREFVELFTTLLALAVSIIEISTTDLPAKELTGQIASLISLSEAPLNNIEFYSQSEFLNTVGFILENLKLLNKHEKLTYKKIQTEIQKGFKRLALIFKGRFDNISRSFLQLPWDNDAQDLEIKTAYCETEPGKIQEILISVVLMPNFIAEREMLVAKCKALLGIINCETYKLRGQKEPNATKALSLLVKSHLEAKDAFAQLPKGEILGELKEFIQREFSKTFIQSHLKETTILQAGNQYFFARYLLRTLPDILSISDLGKIPKEIAGLIIENHGALFDSMITIWDRLSSHYNALLEHHDSFQDISQNVISWDYISKKRDHTKGAMLFFKSCQAVVKAQEYAFLKERTRSEKLFSEASKYANDAAQIFMSVIDTFKGEVQQVPKDLFNFASFCKNQSIRVSQGKSAEELPIKDFVVLIGIISASL